MRLAQEAEASHLAEQVAAAAPKRKATKTAKPAASKAAPKRKAASAA